MAAVAAAEDPQGLAGGSVGAAVVAVVWGEVRPAGGARDGPVVLVVSKPSAAAAGVVWCTPRLTCENAAAERGLYVRPSSFLGLAQLARLG